MKEGTVLTRGPFCATTLTVGGLHMEFNTEGFLILLMALVMAFFGYLIYTRTEPTPTISSVVLPKPVQVAPARSGLIPPPPPW